MITFKQFLQERAENMRAYRKVLKAHGKEALVGFEVEIFIPRDHEIAQDGPLAKEKERATARIRSFDTYAEFEDYFDITRSTQRDIDSDYESWLEHQKELYIKDNLDDDHTEAELTDEFESKQDSEYSWTHWFNDEFATAYDFVNNYDLEPKYGWYEGETGRDARVYTEEEPELKSNWKEDIGDLIADRLQRNYLKRTVEYGQPGTGNGSDFMVVPDSSIDAEPGERKGFGAEVVTPPLPYQDAIDCLSKIFNFIEDEGLQTNSSTGLHINISVPNIKRLDPVKLVLLMGDEHVLKQFKREGNSMARPQIDKVRDVVASAVRQNQTISTTSEVGELLGDIAKRLMSTGKYMSVNLNKLQDGYLEFRSPGNKDYHRNIDTIEQLVGRWMSAMTAACDPQKDREIYLKRLAKLFSENYGGTVNSDMSVVDLFSKKVPGGSAIKSEDRTRFVNALARIGATFGTHYKPTFAQIKELRTLCAKHQVKGADVIKYAMENPKAIALNTNGQLLDGLKEFIKIFKLD